MARFLIALTLIATLALHTGCWDSQARIGVRNAIEAAEYIEQTATEPAVVTAARGIIVQLEASADSFDRELFGLWTDRSKATIPVDAWVASPDYALTQSNAQALKIQEEAESREAALDGLLGTLGISLGGGGVFGLMLAGLIKYRGILAQLGPAFVKMRKAETEDEAKAIEDQYPAAKAVLAKADKAGKVP